jgi:hypothetical protein
MAQEKSGGPSSNTGRPGGDRSGRPGGGGGGRDNRPGGGGRDRRPGGGKGGPRRGRDSGPERPKRVETYEDVKLVTRGADFRIEKSVVAEKGTHKPVRTEYRLHREGLPAMQPFSRLADAQAAATAPLPEPEPEPTPAAEAHAAEGEPAEDHGAAGETPAASAEPGAAES